MKYIKVLINKYKNLSVQIKATMWFTICNIIQNGIHLITMPIYTRMLTTEQYGLSTLYFAWADIVVIFTSLNLGAGVFNNGMVRYPDDRDKFQSAMQGLSTVSSIICILIYFLFAPLFDELFGLPKVLIIAMFCYCIFVPSLKYWTARQRYEYKYVGFTVATLGFAIITSLLSVLFICFFDDKGIMKIWGYIIGGSIVNIGLYVYIFVRGKIFYHKEYWSYALKFNLPLIPHYLSMIVLNQSDRIMIARMCGETQAAIYGVAYSIGKVTTIFNGAITASFTPWIYNKLKKKEYDSCERISYMLFILIMTIVICIMLMGPEVLLIFATEEYMEAVYVIPPIAASIFFMFVYNQVSTVEFYYGKSKYIMCASVVGAVINICLNYFAIPIFGYIAAAYTTLICYILFAVCHFVLMKKLCRENGITSNLFDARKLGVLACGVLVSTMIVNVLYSHTLLRYGIIILLVVMVIVNRRKFLDSIHSLKA